MWKLHNFVKNSWSHGFNEGIYRELVEQEEEAWRPMKERQAFKECWDGRAFIGEILVLCGPSD